MSVLGILLHASKGKKMKKTAKKLWKQFYIKNFDTLIRPTASVPSGTEIKSLFP